MTLKELWHVINRINGNCAEACAKLQDQITALQNQVSELEKKMDTLNSLVTQETADVNDLGTVMTTAMAEFTQKLNDQNTLIQQLQAQGTVNPADLDTLKTNNAALATMAQTVKDFLSKNFPAPAPNNNTAPDNSNIQPAQPTEPQTGSALWSDASVKRGDLQPILPNNGGTTK